MNIINWLNESLERKYFAEDYAADRKKYTELVGADKRLTPEEFDRCCNADPTYKEGSSKSGSYLTWIIKRYTDFRKNNPNKEFDFTSCADDLKSFNEIVTHKLFLKDDDEKHDINYFTSLEALDDFVKSKNTHKKESGKQQQRNQNATTIKVDHVDPDMVFENDRCRVWVPYTYEASRQLGGDTRWCTAASTRGNWDSYSKEGPLFIMIMKDDPKEKYQFFFEKTTRRHPQFMDRNDDPVDLSRFPEMQMPWVDEVRKGYYDVQDKVSVSQLKALLNPDGTIMEENVEKADELVRGLHDNQLVRKYSEPINKVCLELFYSHLTTVLTMDSPSIKYLKCCVGNVDIVLPSSVTSLGDWCFYNCKSLTSITIPNGVTTLESGCFCRCKSLESITIPDSITSMGTECFYECTSLKSITIPSDVTSIGVWCFNDCKSLESITIPSGVAELQEECFSGCASLKSITISSSITSMGWGCFHGCTSLTDVYYDGTKEDRAEMKIGGYNTPIRKAKWHYNYKG